MSATVKTQGTKGTASIAGHNLTYTPSAGQTGSDTAIITISDGQGGTKDITITVNGIDTLAPTAAGETVSTAYNTALNAIDVLANDTDDSGTVLLGAVSSQVGGTFTVVAGKINFTPTGGFSGAASCVYQVKDPSNNVSTATLSVNVAAPAAPASEPTNFILSAATDS